jgi:endoglucanase
MLRHPTILLAAVAAMAAGASSAEPVKLAESARFDITATAAAQAIEGGRAIEGGASIGRMNWVPEAERPRGYTVSFPVIYRAWRTAAIRFTPKQSGTITIALMGPWEEAQKGVVYKQEVIWDSLRIDGAPPGWKVPDLATLQTPDVAAVEGRRYARTWHNRTLSLTVPVTGGRPVTMHLSARAVRPEGFVEMKRIAGQSTPAHRAARRFLHGANLGNGLEAPPGQDWGVHYTPDDLPLIRAEGFDHARIPAGWHHYTGPGPEYRIKPEFFARADELVDAALKNGLAVMINIHHFDDFTTDPKAQTPKFLAIWEQLAAHYAKAPDGLALELLNEPKDAATTEVINPIFAEAIRRIHKIDPDRTIFVGPGKWNGVGELDRLRLPDDDQQLIVTVHSYDPFLFTHQGATWSGPDTKITGIVFPGPPRTPLVPDRSLKVSQWVLDWVDRYNTQPTATNPSAPHVVKEVIDKAKEWSDYYGRPIHFGEFGCFTTADPASRANFYRAFREAAGQAGIGWAIWDWKAGFRYWDEKAGRPEPGMREALFGRPSSRASR